MQVIDLGSSLREVWQEISPSRFVVTLLRTTGENHWEIRSTTEFQIRSKRDNFVTNTGPRSGIDVAEAPQGDVADGGSTPPGSTTHRFSLNSSGSGCTCGLLRTNPVHTN